jgi:hypothetical protein
MEPGMTSGEKESEIKSSKQRGTDMDKAKVKAEYSFSSWAFQRCIGLAYLAAFGSLATQITGLIGHNGILPVEKIAKLIEFNDLNFPLLGVFNFIGTSDLSLQWLCWIGSAAALLASVGFATPIMFFICWILWMSVVNVGQDFLSFQWDILLLEAGFLSIFMAPWRILDWPCGKLGRTLFAPPVVSVWLFRWLLFRLMIESGFCKITSGDETWRSLTAMNYHYHTQPLPTPLAWLFDKSPEFMLKSFTLATLAIELLCPLLIPIKRLRLVAAFILMFLQICIAFTGNYAYFNLLTIGLCLFLVEDADWVFIYSVIRKKIPVRFKRKSPCMAHRVSAAVGAFPVLFLSAFQIFPIGIALLFLTLSIVGIDAPRISIPEPLADTANFLSRFYIVDHYGLFATMTTVRDEIILEGSADGVIWKEYQFKYKPGNTSLPPCIVAPLQPRLDWQMWFASLGDLRSSPWFVDFVVKIFENSPEVLGLLGTNPFPEKPPEYLRAMLYRYTFSSFNDLVHTGNWWQRDFKSYFLPVISRSEVMKINQKDKPPKGAAMP